jgi:hypothetical protein
MGQFQPWYVFPNEYKQYGLPQSPLGLPAGTIVPQPDIDNLVQLASIMVDEYCGRTDGDGNGSLVYTTYQERLLMQSPGRNLVSIPIKPIVAITPDIVASLMALDAASGGYFYTGVQASTIYLQDGRLSGILAASGRYAYTRRDMSQQYTDLNSLINPQSLVTLFGGPAPFIAIDLTNLDYDPKTGEVWLPAGLQLWRYSEVILTYTSGYDPRNMPRQIKLATAAVTKNLLTTGGTTGLTSMNLGRAAFNVNFGTDVIDDNIKRILKSFMTVRAY